ncbi:MAG: hypothetical protein IT459_07285 [Planctomycetes bacterium]|nr:hypothetical protein [Planctomycetota bacterium]
MKPQVSEPRVKRAVERHMDAKGYIKIDSREKHETGIDLEFRHRGGGRYVQVEAKGDSDAKSQMETKLIRGLGQLVTKFVKHPNRIQGLAVPAHWERRALGKIPLDAMIALNLVIFLVDPDGRVREVSRRNYGIARAAAGLSAVRKTKSRA